MLKFALTAAESDPSLCFSVFAQTEQSYVIVLFTLCHCDLARKCQITVIKGYSVSIWSVCVCVCMCGWVIEIPHWWCCSSWPVWTRNVSMVSQSHKRTREVINTYYNLNLGVRPHYRHVSVCVIMCHLNPGCFDTERNCSISTDFDSFYN